MAHRLRLAWPNFSELVDTEIYHLFVSRVTTRFQWLRVLVSNSVSVPIDNLIFVLIAFSPFALLGAQLVDSWAVAWEIFVFNLLVKYGVTLVSMPLIYLTWLRVLVSNSVSVPIDNLIFVLDRLFALCPSGRAAVASRSKS